MHFDTIAAIATAPGEAGIGIIRISGNEAKNVANSIFRSKKGKKIEEYNNRTLVYGRIFDEFNNIFLDEVLVSFMKAPHTYTCEDVIEINCHGGMISTRKILELILKYNVRLAEAGEFTKRGFLNGRIDLAQAEAIMDLIQSKTDSSYELAFKQLEGSLSNKIINMRSRLLDTLAHLHVSIDYTEEDINEITYEELKDNATIIKNDIDYLLETSRTGKIIREGLNTAIIGKPNVGKSSLLNSLLRESRAIVTDIPGTTRDVIEEQLNLRGIPLKIVDTAGIRDTEDIVEKIGVEKSKESLSNADLILFVIDSSTTISEGELQLIELIKNKDSITILNKIDLDTKTAYDDIKRLMPKNIVIEVSIENRTGLDKIEDEIENLVCGGEVKGQNDALLANIRHKVAMDKAKISIEEGLNAIDAYLPYDLIEVDLKDCYDSLGEITGETLDDDIIDKIFSNFCLGK